MHLLVEVLRIFLLLPTACVPLRTAAATTKHVAATTTTTTIAAATATCPALLAALLITPLAFKPLLLECLPVLHLLPPLGVDGIAAASASAKDVTPEVTLLHGAAAQQCAMALARLLSRHLFLERLRIFLLLPLAQLLLALAAAAAQNIAAAAAAAGAAAAAAGAIPTAAAPPLGLALVHLLFQS
jgi:hypothetical protein